MPLTTPWTRIPSALLVILLLAGTFGCADAPADTATAETRISTPLEPTGPSGEVHGAVTFSWRGTSDDRVVRIFIVDSAERAVTDFEARGRSAVAPQIVLDAIRPGEAMGWRVAVLDENGQPARMSPLTRFVWQPR